MEINTNQVEPVTLSEVLELASWDRPRDTEELHQFVSRRMAALAINDTDLDF